MSLSEKSLNNLGLIFKNEEPQAIINVVVDLMRDRAETEYELHNKWTGTTLYRVADEIEQIEF